MAQENIDTATSAAKSAESSNDGITAFFTEDRINSIIEWAAANGLKLIAAILIFVIGKWVVGKIRNGVKKAMEKKQVDPALVSFGSSILYYMLMIAVILAAIQQIGFQTTSLVAIIGAAGLAVGLALQGSLSNFAAGVLIIMFRPFRIGDVIDAGGHVGSVKEIGVLVTIMHSPDNKKIIVPNSAIMSGSITNITANDTRRVDMSVGVSYSDDLDKVTDIIKDVLKADERVLPEPAPQVVVSALADSSVNFHVRPWTKKEDYWGVFFDFQKTIKQRLDKEGVSIPFPQRDVHLHKVD
ncbi:mechanosensitive ion channel domain-containing protein [Pelagicoccus sp. SDUM812005]|uniref:mechanosensitive ion channel family protein n=1 Tax=Pelagicoccus sp. SDUM812005 TaxID=3041257 RepID=UPI0028105D8B|nr:mechanosensitive ion channel domain-containing protein [Pelagicoccus sp. SDUM812005]MDQ8181847.1 mechanosensitive ion channel [Pelagicoccus sp. SDUM812005]